MEESRFSAFPHHSWMSWQISGRAGERRLSSWTNTSHLLVFGRRGRCINRWIHRGRETRFNTADGHVGYFPADGEQHIVSAMAETPYETFFLALPSRHLADLAAAHEVDSSIVFRPLLTVDDAQVRRSLSRLAAEPTPGESSDEHARALALRMVELMGAHPPAWHRDHSVFTATTMNDLVDYIDSHLGRPIALDEIAIRTGLSPSHFARKFRQSSGLSLHRFVNLRRTRAAIGRLQGVDTDLGRLSLDLGFCSQSHLTRVFREHTGMSPARFRRQFRRTVG